MLFYNYSCNYEWVFSYPDDKAYNRVSMGKVVFNTFSDYANTEKVYKAVGFAEKVIF